jgi:taurine dioxygenase
VLPAIAGHDRVLAIDGAVDRASWWHTDVTFLKTPPLGSILAMRECPEVGGDTMWASTQDAYDALSEPLRTLCDGLSAVHHDPWFAEEVSQAGGYTWEGRTHAKLWPVLHPVVRVHPENGRKGLFVNRQFTRALMGMSEAESRHLLELLYEHSVRPELTCRWRWTPGAVAFWDNRATMHHALDDYGTATRYAHRVTIRGDEPKGP